MESDRVILGYGGYIWPCICIYIYIYIRSSIFSLLKRWYWYWKLVVLVERISICWCWKLGKIILSLSFVCQIEFSLATCRSSSGNAWFQDIWLHEVSLRRLLWLGTASRHPLNCAQCVAQLRGVAPSRSNSQVCFLHSMQKLMQLVIRPSFRAKTCNLLLYLYIYIYIYISLSFSSSLSIYIYLLYQSLSFSLYIYIYIYIYVYTQCCLSYFLSPSIYIYIYIYISSIYIYVYSPLETSRNLYTAISAKKFTVQLLTELLSDASIYFRGVCACTIKNDQGSCCSVET